MQRQFAKPLCNDSLGLASSRLAGAHHFSGKGPASFCLRLPTRGWNSKVAPGCRGHTSRWEVDAIQEAMANRLPSAPKIWTTIHLTPATRVSDTGQRYVLANRTMGYRQRRAEIVAGRPTLCVQAQCLSDSAHRDSVVEVLARAAKNSQPRPCQKVTCAPPHRPLLCSYMPKCHWLPLQPWRIPRSRLQPEHAGAGAGVLGSASAWQKQNGASAGLFVSGGLQ